MHRIFALALVALAVPATISSAGLSTDKRATSLERPGELERWSFLAGKWDMVSTRYSFDGAAIETNRGSSEFSWAMQGLRLQERQSITFAGRPMEVLNVFGVHPERHEWELARTDSVHHSFDVMRGQGSGESIVFFERDPSPESEVVRRLTYEKLSEDSFSVLLEFSLDAGVTWLKRSETVYTRR